MMKGHLSREQFLEKYGHIRPGTYDILSPRYDEAFEQYFGQNGSIYASAPDNHTEYCLSPSAMEKIQYEITQSGLAVTAEELVSFIKDAIEGREFVKFVFTKCVSRILQLVVQLGERNHISKEAMSHVDIAVIKQLYVDLYYDNLRDVLKANIEMNQAQYDCARMMKLPGLIVQPDDIYRYALLNDEPNFITSESITAETVEEEALLTKELTGKIVFIKAADPGYDFVFTKQIGGLITQFGGVNSHMAIRCAELNIPAVIGAGEKNYEKWRQYPKIYLDCNNRKVEAYGVKQE